MAGRLAGAGAGLAVAVFSLVPAGAQAAAAGGTWGTAEQVQGLPALSSSSILSLSCASPGNCGAGGYLVSGDQQAIVVSETNGTWGTAEVVPGSAALNTGGAAQIGSVSCASPGNCTAGGYITSIFQRAFVVSQVNGKWGDAQKVPGLATMNTIGVVHSVSCAAPGNCTAGGYFVRPPGTGLKAFVVVQRNGTWGKALQIRGMSEVDSLSCATASNCSAGGGPFAVSKINGSWGKAEKVPGLANLSRGGNAHIESLSCAAPGNCAAGGFIAGNGGDHAFLASQTGGTWGTALKVPGLAAGPSSFVNSVSCGAAGTCAAVGSAGSPIQGFVISEDNGTWGTAINPPGLAALNKGGGAQINAVSCATADNCAAGGDYADSPHGPQAFTVSQTTTPAP